MKILASIFLSLLCLPFVDLSAQTNINVLSYNLLNFPEGLPLNRQDTLRKIVNFVQPDLFLLQELKNSLGLSLALDACSDLEGNYTAAQWWSQQSNFGTDFPLQQSIIFNSDMFGLVEQDFILTSVRDINYFKLYLKTDDLESGADTTYLTVFVTHLKAGSGSSEQQQRAAMVQNFINALPALSDNQLAIFAGDFNVYNSNEEAYQMLLSPDNAIVFEDPINAPGTWSSSAYPFKQILTQSTRSSTIYNDGAGGGIDDRFDFILASQDILSGTEALTYVEDSYHALGNNGTCYNQSITSCNVNNDVPFDIIRALYFMSDHLPVVMQLQSESNIQVTEAKKQTVTVASAPSGIFISTTELVDFNLYDISGRLISTFQNQHGGYIELMSFPIGSYFVVGQSKSGITFNAPVTLLK
ncbi:MAG: hypothetical protein GC193_02345 [Cryomorphaceae bacterium]|nr:hypothetical protein [Cryomorphaceae bacterium]